MHHDAYPGKFKMLWSRRLGCRSLHFGRFNIPLNNACIAIMTLLRERVLQVALNYKAPRDAEFTST
jgi:hypothetical protein